LKIESIVATRRYFAFGCV